MPEAPSGPATFSEILGASWGLFKKFFKPVLAGSIIVAAVGTLPSYLLPSLTRMDYLLQTGSVAAAVIAGILVATIVGVVSYIAYLFFLVLGAEQRPAREALRRATQLFFPTIGVGILTLIRTYAWIPLLLIVLTVFLEQARALIPLLIIAAIVLGIWRGPRYAPSQVLYVLEGKGIMGSVDRSFSVTKGYWGKVVGNLLLMGLIAFVVSFVSGMVFGLLGASGTGVSISALSSQGASAAGAARLTLLGGISQFALQIVGQLVAALNVFFLVHLTKTIVAHPR